MRLKHKKYDATRGEEGRFYKDMNVEFEMEISHLRYQWLTYLIQFDLLVDLEKPFR